MCSATSMYDCIEWPMTGVPCENHHESAVGARLLAANGPSDVAADYYLMGEYQDKAVCMHCGNRVPELDE